MSVDRHIRRSGGDYGTAFVDLLPQGLAWPREPGSTIDLVCRGLAEYWGYVDGRAADLLERESDPRITMELLPDWERNWGLPDPCYSSPQTIGERQRALVQRMTLLGSQSRQFFIDFCAYIGYSITISEYRPFVVGLDRCGDSRVYGDGSNPMFADEYVCGYLPVMNTVGLNVKNGELSEYPNYGLAPAEIRYYWTVHVSAVSLTWFRVGGGGGQCGVDPHLRIGRAQDLECILARWKPAHTQIIYDYSGLTPTMVVAEAANASDLVDAFGVYEETVTEAASAAHTQDSSSIAAPVKSMVVGTMSVFASVPLGMGAMVAPGVFVNG